MWFCLQVLSSSSSPFPNDASKKGPNESLGIRKLFFFREKKNKKQTVFFLYSCPAVCCITAQPILFRNFGGCVYIRLLFSVDIYIHTIEFSIFVFFFFNERCDVSFLYIRVRPAAGCCRIHFRAEWLPKCFGCERFPQFIWWLSENAEISRWSGEQVGQKSTSQFICASNVTNVFKNGSPFSKFAYGSRKAASFFDQPIANIQFL